MKPLYEISIEYQRLINDLSDCDEIDEGQVQLLNDLTSDIKEKAINVGAFIKNMEAEAQAIECGIAEMEKRKSRLLNKSQKLKDYLKQHLEECEMREIKSTYFDIKIRSNPSSVMINDEALIPKEYIRETILSRIDKTQLSQALKNNMIIPGALLVRNTRLEIR
jgi:hypothetical protein